MSNIIPPVWHTVTAYRGQSGDVRIVTVTYRSKAVADKTFRRGCNTDSPVIECMLYNPYGFCVMKWNKTNGLHQYSRKA